MKMSIVEVYPANHASGAHYDKFDGTLKVGDYIRIFGRVSKEWMESNSARQGCVRITDLDGEKSIKFGTSNYSSVDMCGYNRFKTASKGADVFVATVYAKPVHAGRKVRIEVKCVNPVSGTAILVDIPVAGE